MWRRERDDEMKAEEQAEGSATATPAPAAGDVASAETGAAATGAAAAGTGMPEDDDPLRIRDRIIAVLKTVYDPEIPVDIYELGLVYGVEVGNDAEVHVTMTLTTPMCPVAETLPPEVEDKIRNVRGVKDVTLDLVWDPPWSIEMMSDAARLELNLM